MKINISRLFQFVRIRTTPLSLFLTNVPKITIIYSYFFSNSDARPYWLSFRNFRGYRERVLRPSDPGDRPQNSESGGHQDHPEQETVPCPSPGRGQDPRASEEAGP